MNRTIMLFVWLSILVFSVPAIASDPPDWVTECATFGTGPCDDTDRVFLGISDACFECVAGDGFINSNIFGNTPTGNDCEDVVGVAAAGSHAGRTRTSLCLGALSCIRFVPGGIATLNTSGEQSTLACGDQDFLTCAETTTIGMHGQCATVLAAATETPVADPGIIVLESLVTPSTGFGGEVAWNLMTSVATNCAGICD